MPEYLVPAFSGVSVNFITIRQEKLAYFNGFFKDVKDSSTLWTGCCCFIERVTLVVWAGAVFSFIWKTSTDLIIKFTSNGLEERNVPLPSYLLHFGWGSWGLRLREHHKCVLWVINTSLKNPLAFFFSLFLLFLQSLAFSPTFKLFHSFFHCCFCLKQHWNVK